MSEFNEEKLADREQIKRRLKTINVGKNVCAEPKVSVVIPVYNNAAFIAETLRSALAQTFENYEIILINDGSPDTSELEKVLEPFADKIIYAEQENLGPSRARNAAICLSRGEFIAFLDGDDVWLPDFLTSQIERLEKENADMIYCDALLFGEPFYEGKTFMSKSPSSGEVTTEAIINGDCNIITSGTVLRKNVLEKTNLFDTNLRGMEDFDLWFRLLKNGAKIIYQRKVLAKYRINLSGLSGSAVEVARRSVFAMEVLKKKYDLTAGEEKKRQKRLNEFSAQGELEQGKSALIEKNYKETIHHLSKANNFYQKSKLTFLILLIRLFPTTMRFAYKFARPKEFEFVAQKKDSKNHENQKQIPSLKSQSVWLLFSKVVGLVFAFLLPLLVVRFLNRENVGVYRQSFLVITNATSFLSLGFAMSAYYFLSREIEKRASAIANILLFHLVTGGLAFIVLLFFPQILGSIFQSPEMIHLAPLIGAVIWIWIFSTFLETVAVANRDVRQATIFIIFAQISKTLFLTSAVVVFQTVESLLYAALFQGIVQTLILLFYLRSNFPNYHRAFNRKFFGEHLVYALPFGFAGVLWMLQNDIHNYFVGYRFGEADFAVYAYGCFQLPLISMVVESVGAVLIPRMSELELAGDKEEMIRLAARSMEKLALVCLPFFVFLFITAEVFVVTLFTREYRQSIPIFQINLLLIPFFILVSDPIIRAYKDLGKFLLKIRFVFFLALIVALYFGIHHFDLRGMIAIVVVTNSLEKLLIQFIVARKLNAGFGHLHLLKNIGKTALISIIAGAATFVVYHFVKDATPQFGEKLAGMIFSETKANAVDFISGILTLSVSFAVFAAVYLFGINFTGLLEESEKRYFKNILGKVNLMFRKDRVASEQFQ